MTEKIEASKQEAYRARMLLRRQRVMQARSRDWKEQLTKRQDYLRFRRRHFEFTWPASSVVVTDERGRLEEAIMIRVALNAISAHGACHDKVREALYWGLIKQAVE